jgi:hypothetical protein
MDLSIPSASTDRSTPPLEIVEDEDGSLRMLDGETVLVEPRDRSSEK